MKNTVEIRAWLKNRLMELASNDDTAAKSIWKECQGTGLDALAVRSKVFQNFPFCFNCGERFGEEEIRITTNGHPHHLMPCSISQISD